MDGKGRALERRARPSANKFQVPSSPAAIVRKPRQPILRDLPPWGSAVGLFKKGEVESAGATIVKTMSKAAIQIEIPREEIEQIARDVYSAMQPAPEIDVEARQTRIMLERVMAKQ